MWQTGQRALDIYRLVRYVDGVLFIASPLSAEDRGDAMALSVEASIMRTANQERPFTGGLYLGRHVNGDVYSIIPPAEAIGTLVASGAAALHIYGYSGLDDGGVLFRMDDVFKESLRSGNQWAARRLGIFSFFSAAMTSLRKPRVLGMGESSPTQRPS